MAKQLPSTLVNFNLFVAGSSHAGTAKTIDLPEIVKKTEDYRAAGMIGDIKLDMGFEALESKVTYTGVDSRHIATLENCGVNDEPIRFIGAYKRQDTCEFITREVYMRGHITSLLLGEMTLGELNDTEHTYNNTYLRIVDNGIELLELDFVNGIYKVMGKDKMAEINQRLGL